MLAAAARFAIPCRRALVNPIARPASFYQPAITHHTAAVVASSSKHFQAPSQLFAVPFDAHEQNGYVRNRPQPAPFPSATRAVSCATPSSRGFCGAFAESVRALVISKLRTCSRACPQSRTRYPRRTIYLHLCLHVIRLLCSLHTTFPHSRTTQPTRPRNEHQDRNKTKKGFSENVRHPNYLPGALLSNAPSQPAGSVELSINFFRNRIDSPGPLALGTPAGSSALGATAADASAAPSPDLHRPPQHEEHGVVRRVHLRRRGSTKKKIPTMTTVV